MIELWQQYQDERPKFLKRFELLEIAKIRGMEYSHTPMIYGTVSLRVDGIEIGQFHNGKYESNLRTS